jgi:hypothetical protein
MIELRTAIPIANYALAVKTIREVVDHIPTKADPHVEPLTSSVLVSILFPAESDADQFIHRCNDFLELQWTKIVKNFL